MTDKAPEVIDGLMPIEQLEQNKTQLATILTSEQAHDAGFFLRVVRESQRRIKAHYLEKRKPFNKDLKDLKAEEERRMRPFNMAEMSIAAPLMAWQIADRQRVEAERKAQLEQAVVAEQAKRAADIATLNAKASEAKGVEKQMMRLQARALALAPLTPKVSEQMATPTKIAGVHLSERWSAEVGDFQMLVRAVADGRIPMAALLPNQEWLDEQATALRSEMNYPGVQAVSRQIQTARGL